MPQTPSSPAWPRFGAVRSRRSGDAPSRSLERKEVSAVSGAVTEADSLVWCWNGGHPSLARDAMQCARRADRIEYRSDGCTRRDSGGVFECGRVRRAGFALHVGGSDSTVLGAAADHVQGDAYLAAWSKGSRCRAMMAKSRQWSGLACCCTADGRWRRGASHDLVKGMMAPGASHWRRLPQGVAGGFRCPLHKSVGLLRVCRYEHCYRSRKN